MSHGYRNSNRQSQKQQHTRGKKQQKNKAATRRKRLWQQRPKFPTKTISVITPAISNTTCKIGKMQSSTYSTPKTKRTDFFHHHINIPPSLIKNSPISLSANGPNNGMPYQQKPWLQLIWSRTLPPTLQMNKNINWSNKIQFHPLLNPTPHNTCHIAMQK